MIIDEKQPVEPMRQRTLRGLAFTATRGAMTAAVRIGTVAIIARILTPGEFGLYASAVVFVVLASMVVQKGLGDSLVQRLDLSADDSGTAMTLLIAAGTGFAIVYWILAPWLARAIALPDVAPVLRGLAIILPIGSLAQVYLSDASRRLHFERIAIVDTLAVIVGNSGMSIALALAGWGVWSLVGGMIGEHLVRLIGFAPGAWRRYRPSFSTVSVRRLFGFSALITVWNVAGYLIFNIDRLVLARFMGADAVGYFSRARNFVSLFVELFGMPVNQVLFPVLAKLQTDRSRLFAGYRQAVALCALLGIPCAIAVAALAQPIVQILLGPQWKPVIPLVRILAPTVFLGIAATPFVAIVRGMGEVRETTLWTCCEALATTVGMILLYPYGLEAVALVALSMHAVGYVVVQAIVARELRVPIREVLVTPMRSALIYAAAMLITWLGIEFIAGLSTDSYAGAAVFLGLAGLEFLVLFFALPRWFLDDDLMWTRDMVMSAQRRLRRAR
jgi:PST family polysaccharide transporter